MTSNQFKAELKLLGLTQASFAKLIGVTGRTINTIANKEVIAPLYEHAVLGVKFKQQLKGDQSE